MFDNLADKFFNSCINTKDLLEGNKQTDKQTFIRLNTESRKKGGRGY